MEQLDPMIPQAETPAPPRDSPLTLTLPRPVLLVVLLILVGFVAYQVPRLWRDYWSLKRAWDGEEFSRVIHYIDITPHPSSASPPENWFHHEGDHSLLWGGWDRKANRHSWFRFGKGELDHTKLTDARGRDTIRAIDHPVFEERGEGQPFWNRLPATTKIAAGEFAGVPLAYPMRILDKVLIVNDTVHTQPILVLFTRVLPETGTVVMFDPVVDSKRLTMGHSGYTMNNQPLLYDRQTESLWIADSSGLHALAGPLRGKSLNRKSQMAFASWGEWKSAHPETRLVVGADRSKAVAGL